MPRSLVSYLASQKPRWDPIPESEMMAVLEERFEGGWLLPSPYKIYSLDEEAPPQLGFPVSRSGVFAGLAEQLDEWVDVWIAERSGERVSGSANLLEAYANRVGSICENALLSNFLADYHGIFWLAHSIDVSAVFSSMTRKLARARGTLGSTVGRLQSVLFTEWCSAVRSSLKQAGEKLDEVLGGEQLRGVELFNVLAENQLIFTTPRLEPDLKGARLLLEGERVRKPEAVFAMMTTLAERTRKLAESEPGFAWSLEALGWKAAEIGDFAILDRRLRRFVTGHPSFGKAPDRATMATLERLADRLVCFEILDRLRRGIVWMEEAPSGKILAAGDENEFFSRSTRPLHFERAGILDPLVHRFGMVYDLTEFTRTLGEIAKAGVRKEILSYRQMFLFQRRLDRITTGHRLNFEKFLGDGAFYTTRRALRLILAALDLQKFYDQMADRGFVFNRGIRIALNYGYYRLLPLNVGTAERESLVEFYGPGIVELSRLTTGKVSRDLDELHQYLVNHGYDPDEVRRFFAPLEKATRAPARQPRRHFAHIDEHGQLINEGITATFSLMEQLDEELVSGGSGIMEFDMAGARWAGFESAGRVIGLRPLGRLNLKGLSSVDVLEVAGFGQDEISNTTPRTDTLAASIREMTLPVTPAAIEQTEDLAICAFSTSDDRMVVIGRVSDSSDSILRPVRLPGSQLERLLGLEFPLGPEVLESRRSSLVQLYASLSDTDERSDLPLGPLRLREDFHAFVLGSPVRELH
ncbi:MAG: hypothetical protein KY459_13530 [Acidobacteria bacterium]|nr:hypothetical protein [Acidobacteriota bacterium]